MTELRTVVQQLWEHTPRNVFRTDLTQQRADELKAMLDGSVLFRDICRINYGAQINSKLGAEPSFGKDEYLSTTDEGLGNPKQFYDGDHMRAYAMVWRGMWVDWQPDLFYGPRKPALFENPKVSIRYVSGDSDTFLAWVDEERFYNDHLVVNCVPYHLCAGEPSYHVKAELAAASKHYPLYYLLGIVMSLPVLRYYADLYATGSLQGAFSHVYPDTVKQLPIPQLLAPLPDAPPDWFSRVQALGGAGSTSRTAVRREFGTREQLAAVVTACARRRQETELRRVERLHDFTDFMTSRDEKWRWPTGASLEQPPEETVMLQSIRDKNVSVDLVKTVRNEFRQQVTAARGDVAEAELLQSSIDAISAALFAMPAPKRRRRS